MTQTTPARRGAGAAAGTTGEPNGSEFGGDQKVGRWATAKLERALVARAVGRIPRGLETYHLTLCTLGWCALALASGYAAAALDPRCLWGIHLALVGQYLTDLFDGAVGRHRDTGLVRWGFYMDHLLDFVFLQALWMAYLWILPGAALPWLMLLAALSGACLAHTFLAFAATGEFRISRFGVGPTELRAALLGLNTAVALLGGAWLAQWLPALCAGAALGLVSLALPVQQELWRRDFAAKRAKCDTEEIHSGRL